MKPWLLLGGPLLAGIVMALALLAIGPERAAFYRVEVAAMEAFACLGSLAAALQFRRGDYLRNAWLLFAFSYLLYFVGDLTLTTGLFSDRSWTPLANGILTIVGNIAAAASIWRLARASRIAGLEPQWSAPVRIAVQLVAIGLALVATGSATVTYTRQLAAGDMEAIRMLASCAGDIFCFSLLAPMFLTALSLRGGVLVWTWTLLTLSGLAWLFVDGTASFLPAMGVSESVSQATFETLRCLANAFLGMAGLYQAWILRRGARDLATA
ncbi:MAG TPA: hypothetical protein VK540_11030 [Polyangiaceae bacterium]|nr:hypothetical protein [Polyangiaceae bacterium]